MLEIQRSQTMKTRKQCTSTVYMYLSGSNASEEGKVSTEVDGNKDSNDYEHEYQQTSSKEYEDTVEATGAEMKLHNCQYS